MLNLIAMTSIYILKYLKIIAKCFKRNLSSYLRININNTLFINSLRFKKSNIVIALLIVCLFFGIPVATANSVDLNSKLVKFEKKFSRNFTKKFCNAIAFGLSKKSAIDFAVGENLQEVSKNKILEKINEEELEDQIATKIVEDCGYPLGLSGEKGIEEIKNDLLQLNYFK